MDLNESRVDFESLQDNHWIEGRENRPSFLQPESPDSKIRRNAGSMSSSQRSGVNPIEHQPIIVSDVPEEVRHRNISLDSIKRRAQQVKLEKMREQFAINLRESVELAKEHFSIMTSEHGERNISSLIGMREDI